MHSWIGANPSVRNAKPCKGGEILRRRAGTRVAARGSVTSLWDESGANLLATLVMLLLAEEAITKTKRKKKKLDDRIERERKECCFSFSFLFFSFLFLFFPFAQRYPLLLFLNSFLPFLFVYSRILCFSGGWNKQMIKMGWSDDEIFQQHAE